MTLRTSGEPTIAPGLRTGRDGKHYPSAPLSAEQRDRAIDAAHFLICGQGLSIRAAQERMAERYGIRRSRGAIGADLARFECDNCADVDTRTPGRGEPARTDP